jgi:photosystem II stability/assembly factor-like uncharacterized protein
MERAIFAGSAQWVAATPDHRLVGLFRKRDVMHAWQQLSNGLPEHVEVRAIARHPHDVTTLIAGTQVGPYRTTDGGDSWTSMNFPVSDVVWSVIYSENEPTTLFCGTQGTGVFRSQDDGATWYEFTVESPEGLCKMGFPTRVIGLAQDANNPASLFAALEVGGVVHSADGGTTWGSCNRALIEFTSDARYKSQLFSDTDTEGMLDSHALAISANAPGRVYLANRMGLFSSEDDGQSWHDMDIGRFSPLTYARDIVVSPHDPNTLYAAFSEAAVSDHGSLYRSVDLGQSWQRFDHGVEMRSTLMTICAGRADPDRVYCAARRGQVFGTEDGGLTWHEHPLPRGVEGVYAISC